MLLETLLLEEVEDLVDLLSESESESVFGLHLVGSRIGSEGITSGSGLSKVTLGGESATTSGFTSNGKGEIAGSSERLGVLLELSSGSRVDDGDFMENLLFRSNFLSGVVLFF